jgi:PAS domain S-box-containing protein
VPDLPETPLLLGIEFHFGQDYYDCPFMKSAFQKDDLMAILDGIDDAVVKFDGQANFAAMNQAAAEIYKRLGFDPQQMKGQSVWELFPELKGTLVERQLRQVIEDHAQISYEFFYPKDQRWYEAKGYPASPGAILVFRDITHKKSSQG